MARKTKASQSTSTLANEANTPQDLNMTQIEEQVDYSAQSRSRCGGALRMEREKQGLSIQDVANKLRLSPKQIEALEADKFANLPEPTIVRGFIRNYAKQLRMNAEPLLDAYTVIVPSNTPHELTIKPTSNMHVSSRDKSKVSSYVWAGLLALLALGVWLFYQNYIQKPSPVAPIANTSKVESLPQPALPAAERATDSSPLATELQASTALTLPAANVTAATLEQATPVIPAENALAGSSTTNTTDTPTTLPTTLPTAASASPTTTSANSPAPAGMYKLEFSASQETWVNVTDANGHQIYSKTIFAGSRESIDVTPPVNVTVGNAGGTSMSKNGKAIELAPHSRNNVAHIKLE